MCQNIIYRGCIYIQQLAYQPQQPGRWGNQYEVELRHSKSLKAHDGAL